MKIGSGTIKTGESEECGRKDEEHNPFAGLTWDAPGACSPPFVDSQELKGLETGG